MRLVLMHAVVISAMANGQTSNADTAAAEGLVQHDPLYGVDLWGAGHGSADPLPPPPPPPPISTVEALNVATFDRLIPSSDLPWLVLYVSCAASFQQSTLSRFHSTKFVCEVASHYTCVRVVQGCQ